MSILDEDLNISPPFKWSFSQWETYNTCPAKWKFGSILKYPRKPAGPAASRGLDIHDSVEAYIKGAEVDVLHPAVNRKYIPIFDAFREHSNGDVHTEHRMAFDGEWSICAPVSKHTSCVAVLDAVRYSRPISKDTKLPGAGELYIGEWKSGKPKDTHKDQRLLYAMFGWKAWPNERTEVTTYYLEDTEKPQRTVLTRETGFKKLMEVWDSRIMTMRRDDMCGPKPGFHCRFCDFSKGAGGPCIF